MPGVRSAIILKKPVYRNSVSNSQRVSGLVEMRIGAFEPLTALSQQPLSASASNPPAVRIHGVPGHRLPLPVAPASIRFRDVAPQAEVDELGQRLVAVIPLVAHDLGEAHVSGEHGFELLRRRRQGMAAELRSGRTSSGSGDTSWYGDTSWLGCDRDDGAPAAAEETEGQGGVVLGVEERAEDARPRGTNRDIQVPGHERCGRCRYRRRAGTGVDGAYV